VLYAGALAYIYAYPGKIGLAVYDQPRACGMNEKLAAALNEEMRVYLAVSGFKDFFTAALTRRASSPSNH
jgi:hypothetical protein